MLKLLGTVNVVDGLQPFENNPTVAARLTLRWFSERKYKPTTMQVRVPNEAQAIMRVMGLYGNYSKITVEYLYEIQSNPAEEAQIWQPKTTHDNLSLLEVENSTARAQEVSKLETTQSEKRDDSTRRAEWYAGEKQCDVIPPVKKEIL